MSKTHPGHPTRSGAPSRAEDLEAGLKAEQQRRQAMWLRLGKWLVVVSLVGVAGFAFATAILSTGLYGPVKIAHDENHRPPVLIDDYEEAWCELDMFSIPYAFEQVTSIPNQCCNLQGQTWDIKYDCCDMYVNVWPAYNETDFANYLGYTSIRKFNCSRQPTTFVEVPSNYAPVPQPTGTFTYNGTSINPQSLPPLAPANATPRSTVPVDPLGTPTPPQGTRAATGPGGGGGPAPTTAAGAPQPGAPQPGTPHPATPMGGAGTPAPGALPPSTAAPGAPHPATPAPGPQTPGPHPLPTPAPTARRMLRGNSENENPDTPGRSLRFLPSQDAGQCTAGHPCACTECVFGWVTATGAFQGDCVTCTKDVAYATRRECRRRPRSSRPATPRPTRARVVRASTQTPTTPSRATTRASSCRVRRARAWRTCYSRRTARTWRRSMRCALASPAPTAPASGATTGAARTGTCGAATATRQPLPPPPPAPPLRSAPSISRASAPSARPWWCGRGRRGRT